VDDPGPTTKDEPVERHAIDGLDGPLKDARRCALGIGDVNAVVVDRDAADRTVEGGELIHGPTPEIIGEDRRVDAGKKQVEPVSVPKVGQRPIHGEGRGVRDVLLIDRIQDVRVAVDAPGRGVRNAHVFKAVDEGGAADVGPARRG
jgi:hypothetical protein